MHHTQPRAQRETEEAGAHAQAQAPHTNSASPASLTSPPPTMSTHLVSCVGTRSARISDGLAPQLESVIFPLTLPSPILHYTTVFVSARLIAYNEEQVSNGKATQGNSITFYVALLPVSKDNNFHFAL